jgi:acetyl esterase/lipase
MFFQNSQPRARHHQFATGFLVALACWNQSLLGERPAWSQPPKIIELWSGLAPGETTRDQGKPLPARPDEKPPATRLADVTSPHLSVHLGQAGKVPKPAFVICPGGGFRYTVVDKEGSEPAEWLNAQGIAAFVLRYRTIPTQPKVEERPADPWTRPLTDAQRAIRLIRSQARELGIDPQRVGILGFSAGGHVAALVATASAAAGPSDQPSPDAIDQEDARPNFAMLIYPAYLYDDKSEKLVDRVQASASTPPCFLVHTHDDSLTSLGPTYFYAALKAHKVPAELHIFQRGGHGYGIREVAGANVHTWVEPARHWIQHTLRIP